MYPLHIITDVPWKQLHLRILQISKVQNFTHPLSTATREGKAKHPKRLSFDSIRCLTSAMTTMSVLSYMFLIPV